MQSMKTTAALVMALQTANAISLDRVEQLTVRRGDNSYSMASMIENKETILPFDEIYDAGNRTVTRYSADGTPTVEKLD